MKPREDNFWHANCFFMGVVSLSLVKKTNSEFIMLKFKSMVKVLSAAFLFLGASSAFGYSHTYISKYRSSSVTHFYVSQGLEGEFGQYNLNGSGFDNTKEKWQGYGLVNSVGMEVLSFIHFGLTHNFLDMTAKSEDISTLDGSRFSGDVRFVFQSPVANLQVGGGVLASSMDLQRDGELSEYYGSGVYYNLGLNYYLNSKVSVFGVAKQNDENYVKSSGASAIDQIKAKTTSMGLGFKVWL